MVSRGLQDVIISVLLCVLLTRADATSHTVGADISMDSTSLSLKLKSLHPFKGKYPHIKVHHVQNVTKATGSAAEPFWMENIKHQGLAPFAPDALNYKVFRNVKVNASITDIKSKVFNPDQLFRTTARWETVYTMIQLR